MGRYGVEGGETGVEEMIGEEADECSNSIAFLKAGFCSSLRDCAERLETTGTVLDETCFFDLCV